MYISNKVSQIASQECSTLRVNALQIVFGQLSHTMATLEESVTPEGAANKSVSWFFWGIEDDQSILTSV